VDRLFAVDVVQRRVETREQRMVRIAVFIHSREGVLLKELLFALEVHLGELDETLELNAYLPPIRPLDYHTAEFVQGIHQDAMLVIHGLNSNDAVVVPGQQRHFGLPIQRQV